MDPYDPAFPITPRTRRKLASLSTGTEPNTIALEKLPLVNQPPLLNPLELLHAYANAAATAPLSDERPTRKSPSIQSSSLEGECGTETPTVGQLRWNTDLHEFFAKAGESPGNVSGQPCRNGVFISPIHFLTTAKYFDTHTDGWQLPTRRGHLIAFEELLKHLHIAVYASKVTKRYDSEILRLKPVSANTIGSQLLLIHIDKNAYQGQPEIQSLSRSEPVKDIGKELYVMPFQPHELHASQGELFKVPLGTKINSITSSLADGVDIPESPSYTPSSETNAGHFKTVTVQVDQSLLAAHYIENRILFGSPILDNQNTLVGLFLGRTKSEPGFSILVYVKN